MRFAGFVVAGCMMTVLLGAHGQPAPAPLAGEWSGSLGGTLPLVLHLQADASEALTATMDSPAQGVNGLAGANAKLTGSSFSFEIPLLKGVFTGTVSADGKTITFDGEEYFLKNIQSFPGQSTRRTRDQRPGNSAYNHATTVYSPKRHGPTRSTVFRLQPRVVSIWR